MTHDNHADPSGYSTLHDLDNTRDAVIAAGAQDYAHSIELLPRLYCYSLQRGRIASQTAAIPETLLVLMAHVGMQQEAIMYAEMLSNPLDTSLVLLQIAQALFASDQPAMATQVIARVQGLLSDLWRNAAQQLADQLRDQDSHRAEQLLDLVLRGNADLIEAIYSVTLQPVDPNTLATETADLFRSIRIGMLVLRTLVRTSHTLELRASDLLHPWLDPIRVAQTQRAWATICAAFANIDATEQVIKQITDLVDSLQTLEVWLILTTLVSQLYIDLGHPAACDAQIKPLFDYLWRHQSLDDSADRYSEISKTLVRIGRYDLLFRQMSASVSVNDRLRRQAASALLKIGAHDVALPLIRLLVNYATRCYLLLDAVQVLIDKDELEPVNALYDEVLDTSFLIPTMSSRTDVLLRLAELRLEQGDGAAALAAVRWIEAKKPMNISGGIQSGWPPWREEQPRRMILRGAENYHSALLTLAHRLIESQQPLLVSEICTEVVTLAAKLRGDARPVAILQTLGILAEMPIDAAVLELAHHAQALVERISDSVWQQRLLMALAKVYWMQGDLATAEGLATQIISLEDRAEAELWLALIDEQRLANTAALAARIGDQTRRAKVQSQLAEALRTRGRFAAAQQVAAQIHDPWMRGVSQRTGIRFLIKAERLADATALAAQIDQSHHRAMVQSDLVKAWIAAGQIAQATDLCAQIDEASYQAVAQYDLVSALSAAEQIEAAKAILTQMQPGRWRYRAHLELAQHLVDRERFTEAREIVVMLDDHDVDDTPYSYPAYFHKPLANAANQAAALRIIMNLQIDRGQLSEAEATLNLMSPQDRRELRISLATALIAANQIARATTLVTAVLNAIRMTDDATAYADVEPSSIERLAIHGHLRLAVALAHHIATPFIRVRALCSLALQLRRAGDDAAANSTFDAALAVAQAIDDTQTWQDLEFEQIRDLVEQDRISAAFDLARREPRIATNDHKPDMKLVIHCRTERFLALAQALERRGHTTEAIASIAEAAAIMRPVAARGIADYPLRRAVALLADLQRDAEALELALAIADPRQRADALLHLAYSLPAPSKTAIFHTILGIYGEEDHEYLVTYLHTKVAEHLIRQEEYDTLLTAIDWTDSKPLPLEKVAQCAYSGDGPLTGEPAVDKYRLRRRLMWILAGQGRTLKAQELLAKVEGYQQRSIEQRVLILALAAQGYAPAALAMAAGVTDKEQRSDLLLIVGEALITLGETAAAADLIARLSVTGLYAQERLIVLQQRIGHLSAAEAREKLQRIPLVQQPSAAHILAEHGATEMAVELLDSPAQQQGWETDTHVAARLALAQAYVAQGDLDAALIQLERLPKSVTHDPIRHPPRAFGTYVHQPDPPIAMAQNRSDALTKLAQIMVEQQQPIPALLAISHIDAAEMRINWLCEQIPLLITGNHHHAALAYVTALINAATQIQDTEERIDMLLCANQCFVEMEMYNQAADVARTALESVRHLHKPEDRASQQVEIVHALLSSHCPAEALDLAHRIDDTGKRVNALLAVAAVTPPTTWKQLNALVQRSWRTAQTYAEVLAMLPLAIPIIAEHPELSDALIECIG